MAPSVVLAPEIFDLFSHQSLADHNCDFHLLPVFGLGAMVGAFDVKAQFVADSVESALVGPQGEKGGVGRSVGQHHRRVVSAVVTIRWCQIKAVLGKGAEQRGKINRRGKPQSAKRAWACTVHDLHLARMGGGIKGSSPAVAGIFDKDVHPVAFGQIDRQDMRREVWDVQAGAFDYLRRHSRAAGVGQRAVRTYYMPRHMLTSASLTAELERFIFDLIQQMPRLNIRSSSPVALGAVVRLA